MPSAPHHATPLHATPEEATDRPDRVLGHLIIAALAGGGIWLLLALALHAAGLF